MRRSVLRTNALPYSQHLLDAQDLSRTVLVYAYHFNIIIFCSLKKKKSQFEYSQRLPTMVPLLFQSDVPRDHWAGPNDYFFPLHTLILFSSKG